MILLLTPRWLVWLDGAFPFLHIRRGRLAGRR